jgi:tetratricopeptide (TPR) repeat protein
MRFSRLLCLTLLATALGLGFSTHPAHAQLDRVYTKESTTASTGTVLEITKNGLKLKVGANTKQFSENEIRKVLFQGDPPGLTKAREFAIDGQYEQALDELKAVDFQKLGREVIKADAEYYRLLSRAKLALAGQGDRNAAIAEAIAFATNHRDSFHVFSVAKLLGDLALASKSHAKAIEYYGFLANAPSTESKIESRYLIGVAMLDQDDIPGAQKAFADVASVDVNSTDALRLKTLAKAGQAVALAKGGQGKEGLALAEKLISELNPTDIEMSARIYNAQGASYEAAGDIEGAILAYLHTHLMFSSQPDAHARALSRLVELWPKVGRTERAAEARQELKQRYPGFAN